MRLSAKAVRRASGLIEGRNCDLLSSTSMRCLPTQVAPFPQDVHRRREEARCAGGAMALRWTDHDVQGLLVREARDSEAGEERGKILLVPGSLHGSWAFERWMPGLARSGWTPLAMSFVNHTGSRDVSAEEYLALTPAHYADAVMTVLESLAGHGAVLLGHSMGGLVAQIVAQHYRLKALVLVSSVGPGQLGPIRATPFPTDRPVTVSRAQARDQWFHNISDRALDSVIARLSPESPSVINAYSDGSTHIDTGAIRCPVLVVGPDEDRSPVHDARRIAGLYGVTPLLIPDVGHDMMLEDGGQTAASAITSWLCTLT
ncbi:alpha/beta fold hydrolase [Streptomyces sp. NPDC058476]|uniref:alpha/beta fold hydrolase n=1 Tax=Streptomyces sp. NPDC058476 TaxID=3346519 RepID=UPI0036598068